MRIVRLCLAALLVCAAAPAQTPPGRTFEDLVDTPISNEAWEIYLYDRSQADPLNRDRRQTISVLLSGVRAELQQRLLPSGVIAGTGVSVVPAGNTVTINSLTSSDGLVISGAFASDTLTLTRSTPLAPITIAGFGTAAPWALASSPSGTAPPVRLGTGTPSSSLFLRGDGAWASPPSGGGGSNDGVLTGLAFSGLTLQSTLSTGAGPSVALPTAIGQALNDVVLEFDDTTRVLTFTGGRADGGSLSRTATIPGGGGSDGVLETLTLSPANLLTAELTVGNDVTVDLSSLAGGSGGGGTPSIYKAQLTDVDIPSADSLVFTQYLDIATNKVRINTGGYTLISDADGRERVCVPSTGYYEVAADVAVLFVDDAVERAVVRMHYTIRASGSTTDVEQPEESRQYNRGEHDGVGRATLSSNELTAIYLLEAGACIGTQTRIEQDARLYTIQGDPSFIEVVRLDGGPGSGTVVVGNPGGSGADLATLSIGGVTFTVPSGGGGGGDGVATGGSYNSGAGRIDFSVTSPGSDFSVSGIGDITAVQVGTTSGLSGGGQSGSVSVALNPFGMTTASSLLSSYVIPIGRGALDARKATLTTLADFMCAGTGMSAANGVCSAAAGGGGDITEVSTPSQSGLSGGGDTGALTLQLDVRKLETRVDLDGSDRIPFMNDSDSNDNTRSVTVENLCGHLAGSNLTCDSDGELSASGGGGGSGDITAVRTETDSGLSGGCTSGDCSIELAPQNLPNFGTVALHRSDTLIIRDDSDATVKGIGVDDWFAGHAGPHLSVVPGVNPSLQVTSGGAAAGQYFQADGAGGATWSFVDLTGLLTASAVKPWTLSGGDRPDAIDLGMFPSGLNEGFAFSTNGRDAPFRFRSLIGAPSGSTGGGILGFTDAGIVESVQASTSGHVLTYQSGDYVFAAPTGGGGGGGTVVTVTGNPVNRITLDGTQHTILVPERWAGPAWESVDMPPRALASNTPTNGQFLTFAGGTSGVWRSLGAARTGFSGQGVLAFGGSNSVVTAVSGTAGQFLGVDSSGLPDFLFFGSGITTSFAANCAMVTESNAWQCLAPATVGDVLTAGQTGIGWAAPAGGGGGTPARLPWRGEHVDGASYLAGDFVYELRDTERVVWLADEDTSSNPSIAPGRAWLNLTDTEHYRGMVFDGVAGNQGIYFEHGDMFVYDGDVWLVDDAVTITSDEIDNETAPRFDNIVDLTEAVVHRSPADYDSPTGADAGHIYGDGETSNARLGYLRDGDTDEMRVRAAHLGVSGGKFIGFARDAGGGFIDTHVAGGSIFPPVPSLDVLGQIPSTGGFTFILEIDGGGPFFEAAGITLSIDREDGVDDTREVSLLPSSIDENFFSSAESTSVFSSGIRYNIRARLSGESDDVALHAGDHIADLIDSDSLDRAEAAIRRDIPRVEVNPSGSDGETALRISVGGVNYNLGGGDSGSAVIETLADNFGAGTGGSIPESAAGWDRAVDVVLDRAVTEADDDKDLRVRIRYTQDGQIRWVDLQMRAVAFRTMTAHDAISGTVAPTGGWFAFDLMDGRAGRTLSNTFGRLGALARTRTAEGDDVVRVLLNLTSNTVAAVSDLRVAVELVPLGGGGGEGGGGITRVTAGYGLTGGGTGATVNVSFDPDELDEVLSLVSTDRIVAIDTSDSNRGVEISRQNLAISMRADVVAGRVQTITCDTASGLNCDRSGDTVDVQLDVERLFETTVIEGSDEIPLADDSVASDPTRKATVVSIANHFASGNLIADGQGRLYTSAQQNNTRTTLEGGDWFTFGDEEDVEDRKITVENVGQHFADGVTLTHDTTTGALSIAEDVTLPGQARMATPANSAHDTRLATTQFVADIPGLTEVGVGGNDGLDGLDLFSVYNHIGGNQVPRQKLTWTSLKEALADELVIQNLPDDIVTQAKIADNAVGVPQLKMGSSEMMINADNTFGVHRFAFGVRSASNQMDNNGACTFRLESNNTNQDNLRSRWAVNWSVGICTVQWDYMTSSDDPSVWVVLDSTGAVVEIYEAEDPVNAGDTEAPMSTPLDDDGNLLPGYTAVNVGLPSLAVISALYASTGIDERSDALNGLRGYLMGRGWITSAAASVDEMVNAVTATHCRADGASSCKPSARQWAMRELAKATGQSTTGLYSAELVVNASTWALPN